MIKERTLGELKWITIFSGVVFTLLLYSLHCLFLDTLLPPWQSHLLLFLFSVVTAWFFTNRLFSLIAQIHRQKMVLFEKAEKLAVLEERERISMDLHDGTLQSLYGVGMGIESLLGEIQNERIVQKLETSVIYLKEVMGEIRTYIAQLKPYNPPFARVGFTKSLGDLVEKIKGTTDLNIDLLIEGQIDHILPPEQQLQIEHIIKESLSNIIRHSGAEQVVVTIGKEKEKIHLEIRDNGGGFSIPRVQQEKKGNGLTNMQERAKSIGGDILIQSSQKGTRIVGFFPCVEEEKFGKSRSYPHCR